MRDGDSDAAVVCGETGSGKTTQVPQYLLDDAIERGEGSSCRVVCTQPRRVAALTVAERVCAERCEARGVGGAGSLVGHHVRLDAKVTKDTRLTFMTAGILLRKMHGDPLLRDVSHVVLDEIHERSLDGDFLLALLRDVPRRRRALNMRPLKLVVMSATLDAELFCGYLGNCTAVSAPGRTHPVTTVHLERIHDMLEYSLDEDSRCCRRPAGARRGEEALSRMSERDRSAAMDAWGADGDSAWRGDENPDFDPGYYAGLPDPLSAGATRTCPAWTNPSSTTTASKSCWFSPTRTSRGRGVPGVPPGDRRSDAAHRAAPRAPALRAQARRAQNMRAALGPDPRGTARGVPACPAAACAKSSSPQTSPRPR